MAERDQRQRVVKALGRLHGIAVENAGACPGTPDVAYVGGWIETKWMREWPRRAETIVQLDHSLTSQQRIWHRKHRAAGGRCWVLLQVRMEWLLLDGVVAADHLEVDATRERLIELSHKYWPNGLKDSELLFTCI